MRSIPAVDAISMESDAARQNAPQPLPRSLEDGRALSVVLLLCKRCASISRAELGRGEMMCPCGGQRRVLRIFEDQRRVQLPVAVERRQPRG